jgi:predicted ATP-grasp superfamily ATP-dependent carboligase
MEGFFPEKVWQIDSTEVKTNIPIKIIKHLAAKQASIPVVFGSGGLGMIQSLGERGIKTFVLDDGPMLYRDLSRYSKRIIAPNILSSELDALDFLKILSLCIREYSGNPPILLPTSDYVLDFIIKHYDDICGFSVVASPPLETLRRTLNKVTFYRWLLINGFPCPKTVFSSGSSERDTLKKINNISFPCIVKPELTFKLEQSTGNKLYVASNKEDLSRCFRELSRINMDFVIQEIVPGRPEDQFSLAGYCKEGGKVFGYMMTNKLRQSYFGAGTFVSSADIPELYQIGKAVLKKLNYKGIFEIEFRKDARDGTYKIIEVNPRCWSQIMLATRMKVNVAYYAYRDLAVVESGNDRVMPIKRRKYWMDFERDLGHIKRKMVHNDYSLRGVLTVLLSFPCVEPFTIRDIRPGLVYLKNKIVRKLKKASFAESVGRE